MNSCKEIFTKKIMSQWILLPIGIVCFFNSYGQITNPYSPNSKSNPLSEAVVIPPIPQQPTPNNQVAKARTADQIMAQVNAKSNVLLGLPPSAPKGVQSNNPQMQQLQMQEWEKIKQEERRVQQEAEYKEYLLINSSYKGVYEELMKMYRKEVSFSLKKAVFLIENAYSGGMLNYMEYETLINNRVNVLRWLIKKENIDVNDPLQMNYLIQRFYSENITLSDNSVTLPYTYNFDDYMGDTDWTNMFVTKLLRTRKGQCHSLPLLYLIFAEELNVKAWLSFAPEHSFIQFSDKHKKTFYYFETTCGKETSSDRIMETGYITTGAIKSKLYLDTLSQSGLFSTLMADLIMGYTHKVGYDNLTKQMIETTINLCPYNIQGHLLQTDLLIVNVLNELKKVGNPPIDKIGNYPKAMECHQAVLNQYEKIDGLGYVRIPDEVYRVWLASLAEEKEKNAKQTISNNH